LGTAQGGNPEDMAATSLTYGNDGKWHFYAGTWDTSAGLRSLYVDGALVAQQTGATAINNAINSRVTIGCRDTTNAIPSIGNSYTGLIFDVRIYNTAFNEAQVNYILGESTFSSTYIPGPNPKLVLNWAAGTLLEATNLLGPWTTNMNTAPYTNSSLTDPAHFYRVRVP